MHETIEKFHLLNFYNFVGEFVLVHLCRINMNSPPISFQLPIKKGSPKSPNVFSLLLVADKNERCRFYILACLCV